MARILFFVSSMQGGGAERVAALLSNQWVASGHEVTLVPTFSGRGECIYPLAEDVKLLYLADRIQTTHKSLRTQMIRLWAMRKIIREYEPDVVVSFLTRVNISVVLASIGLGVRVVVSERTYPPMVPLGYLLERVRALAYSKASVVVMQTQKGLQWLQSVSPNANGWVIANPIVYPIPSTEPICNPEHLINTPRRLVLAVGRLREEKGFDTLLTAFAAVAAKFQDWDLVILGEGDARASLLTQCTELGLTGRVELPGVVGNIADWYDRADLFVMSSRIEGFPNGLIEAMAHGLAVISFACDAGPEEIIQHDNDGFLVSLDKGANGLAQALQLLMFDSQARNRLAAEAIRVRDRFQVELIAREWEKPLALNVWDLAPTTPVR